MHFGRATGSTFSEFPNSYNETITVLACGFQLKLSNCIDVHSESWKPHKIEFNVILLLRSVIVHMISKTKEEQLHIYTGL